MKYYSICALAVAALSLPAHADDFSRLQNLSQAEFASLAKDFTAVGSYRAVTPAEPLGIIGFDIGASVTSTKMEHSGIWDKAGFDDSTMYMPRIQVQKGLPFGFDVGASLAAVPGSDIKLMGAELKYAIVEGGTATPAVAVRAAVTRLAGVDQLDLDTRSLELTVSKGFLNLTPYAGVGRVWGTVTPNVAMLGKESPSANKVFAGLNINLGIANLVAEVDSTGGNKSGSIRLGFRL